MSTYKVTIPYTPNAKASWRVGKYSSYNPSGKGMERTRAHVMKQLKDKTLPLLKGPLLVIVHFRIPAPGSINEWRRALMHNYPHIKRPDGDNLEKFVNDALKGILWNDDSVIAWMVRSKSLTCAKTGQTIVYARELEDLPPNYDLIISDIIEHIKIEGEENAA